MPQLMGCAPSHFHNPKQLAKVGGWGIPGGGYLHQAPDCLHSLASKGSDTYTAMGTVHMPELTLTFGIKYIEVWMETSHVARGN